MKSKASIFDFVLFNSGSSADSNFIYSPIMIYSQDVHPIMLFQLHIGIHIKLQTFFLFFRSGHRGPKAYSLLGGVVPSQSIG